MAWHRKQHPRTNCLRRICKITEFAARHHCERAGICRRAVAKVRYTFRRLTHALDREALPLTLYRIAPLPARRTMPFVENTHAQRTASARHCAIPMGNGRRSSLEPLSMTAMRRRLVPTPLATSSSPRVRRRKRSWSEYREHILSVIPMQGESATDAYARRIPPVIATNSAISADAMARFSRASQTDQAGRIRSRSDQRHAQYLHH